MRAGTMILRSLRQIGYLWPFGYQRVLVLEDDPSMQRLVTRVLRSPQIRVDVFGNGRDVVRELMTAGGRYDAVLLDLMMPHDGGLTVLRNLQEHRTSLLSRVILMTGSGSGITDPWSPLVFAVVRKPFETAALTAAVRACLRQPEGVAA